jgi:hypothetical protein
MASSSSRLPEANCVSPCVRASLANYLVKAEIADAGFRSAQRGGNVCWRQ